MSLAVVAVLLLAAGYGLVSALSDRLDPKVRLCVQRSMAAAAREGRVQARGDAVKLCKHLEEIGALP